MAGKRITEKTREKYASDSHEAAPRLIQLRASRPRPRATVKGGMVRYHKRLPPWVVGIQGGTIGRFLSSKREPRGLDAGMLKRARIITTQGPGALGHAGITFKAHYFLFETVFFFNIILRIHFVCIIIVFITLIKK